MRWTLILAVALVGCSDKVSDARKELAMVKAAHGSPADRCKAERKIEAALLETHNEREYGTQKASADVACLTAEIDPYDGMQPDNLSAE